MYEINCTSCSILVDINKNSCPACGNSMPGFINTRRALIESEVNALEKRYINAVGFLSSSGLLNEKNVLEQYVQDKGKVVLNTSFDFLFQMVKNCKVYNSYRRQLVDRNREKASFENDVKRTLHDTLLFGSEMDVVYAALSINDKSLFAYGEVGIFLKTNTIEYRTTALETNSYFFIEDAIKNGWSINQRLPVGYLSTWFTKHKLAIAKLFNKLKIGLNASEIEDLVLFSNGDRATDFFIELYIYEGVHKSNIEKVLLPKTYETNTNSKIALQITELKKDIKIEYY